MSRELESYRLLIADVYELAGASRRSSERIARGQGLTAARWHVMSVVSEESLSVASIARRLGLARQSVQRVAADLAASGHVTIRADPADRRAPRVSLTPTGRVSLAELFAASDADRHDVLARAGASPDDLAQARATIRGLHGALSGAASDSPVTARSRPPGA